VTCLFIASGQITITKITPENRIEDIFENVLRVKVSIIKDTVLCPALSDLVTDF